MAFQYIETFNLTHSKRNANGNDNDKTFPIRLAKIKIFGITLCW